MNYYASLVEVEIATEEIDESTESAEKNDDEGADSSDEEEETDEDTEDENADETEEEDGNLFLLVSNSNEYLDQMEESSEGNLSNLANEVVYARSKADLPQLGEVLVYKVKDAAVWPMLVDIVADKYTYVGLDKVLESVRSTGAAFYSVDSKLRILMSEN